MDRLLPQNSHASVDSSGAENSSTFQISSLVSVLFVEILIEIGVKN